MEKEIKTDNFDLEEFNKSIKENPDAMVTIKAVKNYIDLREKAFVKKLAKVFKDSES